MNHIDDILSSDLLKRYILGNVTHEEKMKVDLLKIEYRAIRDEIRKLETSVSSSECIIKNISGHEAPHTHKRENYKIVSLLSSWWRLAVGLVLGAISTWFMMESKINNHIHEIERIESDLIYLEKDYEELNEQYIFINHAGTIPYLLKHKAFQKVSQVIVYWNHDLEKSQLKVIELPAISKDQTYQLWADVDGEMQSLGVFDPTIAIVDPIDIKFVGRASSFNITVEQKGGSEHPTLKALTASVTI